MKEDNTLNKIYNESPPPGQDNAFLKKSGGLFKDTLIKSLLSPAVLTVAITGIAGPLAVNSVNGHIETLKLQKEVMDRVMDITRDTNFKNYDEVHKIKIISEMIGENVGSFGLNFTQTAKTFEEIYKATVNIQDYEKAIEAQGEKINTLEEDKNQKQRIINNIFSEKTTLEQEKEKLIEEQQKLNLDQVHEKEEFSRKIREKQQEIEDKLRELQEKQKEKDEIDLQLVQYQKQNHNLKEKIDAAKKENIDLSNKIGEYQNVISRYGSDKKLLEEKILEMTSLLNQYQSRLNALQAQYDDVHGNYETLHADYKKCLSEKINLEKQVKELKTKADRLEKAAAPPAQQE